MKINLQYNDFSKSFEIEINNKIGTIQEKFLSLCSLLIYNIEYIKIFFDDDESYILGSDGVPFSSTFDEVFSNFIKHNEETDNNIIKCIIYDRKRDELGNVIKENIIIDNYNKWYQSYQNELYINNFNNQNDINLFNINSNNNNNYNNFIYYVDDILRVHQIRRLLRRANISENVEENSSENVEENSSENVEENSSEKIEENSSENVEENSSENIEENSSEKIEENSSEKIEENSSENVEENSSENIEENSSENVEENSSENNLIHNILNEQYFHSNHNNIFNNININNIHINNISNRYPNFLNLFENIMSRNIEEELQYEEVEDENNDYINMPPLISINTENIYENTYENIYEDVIIGLNEEQFNKLEILEFNFDCNQKDCLICMEEYIKKDEIIKLKCDHTFHKNCIKQWLCKENNKCPICRIEVDKGIPLNI